MADKPRLKISGTAAGIGLMVLCAPITAKIARIEPWILAIAFLTGVAVFFLARRMLAGSSSLKWFYSLALSTVLVAEVCACYQPGVSSADWNSNWITVQEGLGICAAMLIAPIFIALHPHRGWQRIAMVATPLLAMGVYLASDPYRPYSGEVDPAVKVWIALLVTGPILLLAIDLARWLRAGFGGSDQRHLIHPLYRALWH